MSSPAILIGKHCRLCHALIPLSIAGRPTDVVAAKLSGAKVPIARSRSTFGTEENGYLCEKCLTASFDYLHQLNAEVEQFFDSVVEVDMGIAIAPPCAKCGTIEGDERILEDYEGRKAMLCIPCAKVYLRANRDKIRGTKLEYELKLR